MTNNLDNDNNNLEETLTTTNFKVIIDEFPSSVVTNVSFCEGSLSGKIKISMRETNLFCCEKFFIEKKNKRSKFTVNIEYFLRNGKIAREDIYYIDDIEKIERNDLNVGEHKHIITTVTFIFNKHGITTYKEQPDNKG